MREEKISIAPYEFIDLLELNISKKINEHATAKIVGHISEEIEDKYVEMASNDEWITITAIDEQGSTAVLFNGIIKSVSVRIVNNVRTLEVDAISGSYLMDINTKSRTFQNIHQTYGSIMSTIAQSYENGGIITAIGGNEEIKTLIVQYNETDWQFAKRLASHFNSILVPECRVSGAKFYFGMPNYGEAEVVDSVEYTLKKDVGEYIYKTKNKVNGINENDSIYYIVKSREIYDLCKAVNFKERQLYVYEVNTKLEGAVLMHYYSFKNEQGFKTKKIYNEKIIGASIDSTVLAVEKDKVKVHAHIDGSQDIGGAIWLPYSTIYSSPEGPGWYCMPEVGDKVVTHLPNEKEKNAYIISAVHEQGCTEGKRCDPDVKVLSTKYGKEVTFHPKGIELKSGDGLYIKMLDDEGIIIQSDKMVIIKSLDEMDIISNSSVNMSAVEGIEIKQGDKASMTINNDITFRSQQFRIGKSE